MQDPVTETSQDATFSQRRPRNDYSASHGLTAVVCDRCGGAVINTSLHSQWHRGNVEER